VLRAVYEKLSVDAGPPKRATLMRSQRNRRTLHINGQNTSSDQKRAASSLQSAICRTAPASPTCWTEG